MPAGLLSRCRQGVARIEAARRAARVLHVSMGGGGRKACGLAEARRLNVSVPPFSVLQLRVPLRTVKRSF